LQGSLGSAQMDRADDIVFERSRIAEKYDNAFANLDWLKTPPNKVGYAHGYQSYACLFEPEVINENSVSRINGIRNSWMDKLQKDGVSTRPATHAVHMLSYYKDKYGIKPTDFPNSYAADHCSLSLPLFHGMKEDEQDFVIDKVLKFQL